MSPIEKKAIDKVADWKIIEDDYYHNYGYFTLWVNKNFAHAMIIYDDYEKEHFLPPYYFYRYLCLHEQDISFRSRRCREKSNNKNENRRNT